MCDHSRDGGSNRLKGILGKGAAWLKIGPTIRYSALEKRFAKLEAYYVSFNTAKRELRTVTGSFPKNHLVCIPRYKSYLISLMSKPGEILQRSGDSARKEILKTPVYFQDWTHSSSPFVCFRKLDASRHSHRTTTGIRWKAPENNYQNENKHCYVLSGCFYLPGMQTACNASQTRGIFREFCLFRFLFSFRSFYSRSATW